MQNYYNQAKLAEKQVDKLEIAFEKVRVIKNEEDLKRATEFLITVKAVSRAILGNKSPIIKSMNDALREVRGLFRPAEDRLTEAERQVKVAILAYNDKVEAKALRDAEKIEEKVDEGKMKLSTGMGKLEKIQQPSQPVQVESGSAQFRTIKKIRIVDISQLKAYMERPRVQEAIRMEISQDIRNGYVVPPGVEVYEEKVVAGVGG